MSDLTDNSPSNQLISANSQEFKNDDKYKWKCISITKLIKEMIFRNGALDMKLKDNHKEIVKLKKQREFLITKLINYENFELSDIQFDLNDKSTDNQRTKPKSKTKKRVKSTDVKKVNKRAKEDNDKLKACANSDTLRNEIKIKLSDLIKSGLDNEELKETNITNSDILKDDNSLKMKNVSKLSSASNETIKIDQLPTNSINVSSIASSITSSINSPSTSSLKSSTNLSSFNSLTKPNSLHQPNILTGNKIILSKNIITGSRIISSMDPTKANQISSPNLVSNNITINNHSSLSNSSNHFLNANKDNVRIIINNQPNSNQFVIRPVSLNQKNIIKNKIIKSLNSNIHDGADENSKHNKSLLNNSFYLNQKQDVQNYVNLNDLKDLDDLSDSKSNLMNDLDKNGKTISFGLIV